jgi:predicted DNA-binding transcriptional regulator YafY
MSKKEDYDKALFRIINILTKLSNDERPTSKELAEEYNVSIRTIQRDINNRLIFFPIIKDSDGRYMFLDGFTLNKTQLSIEEITSLALSLDSIKNAGKMFNENGQKIFQKVSNTDKFFSPYHIKSESYEYLDTDSKISNTLESAIEEKNETKLTLKTRIATVKPLKILNLDGIWYLVAIDAEDEKVKIFFISDIKSVKKLTTTFKYTASFGKMVENINSPFFVDGNSFKIKILVKAKVAHYFKLKKHISSQDILDEDKDGNLIIEFEVSNEEDVDNLIKSWIPDVVVLEPKEYRDKIKQELKEYLLIV